MKITIDLSSGKSFSWGPMVFCGNVTVSGVCGNPCIKTPVMLKFQKKIDFLILTHYGCIFILTIFIFYFSLTLLFVYRLYSSKMDASSYSKNQFNSNLKYEILIHLLHWKLLQILFPEIMLPRNCGLLYFNLGSC